MQKRPNAKIDLEYRHYELPVDFPLIALLEKQYAFPPLSGEDFTYMHMHNCLEIGYCYEGEGAFTVENRITPTHPGCVSVICPYAMHISYCTKKQKEEAPAKWEYLYVNPVRLFEGFFPDGLPLLECFVHDSASFPNVFYQEDHPEISRLTRQILEELRMGREDCRLAVQGLMLALLVSMSRVIMQAAPSGQEQQRSSMLTLAPAIQYINMHYAEHIPPETLAGLCHMSLTHFRRSFKSVMGRTPLDYIHHVRVHKACELLYTTENSILDISLAVGYESISCFNRHFVGFLGEPPSNWRNNRRMIQKKDVRLSVFPMSTLLEKQKGSQ